MSTDPDKATGCPNDTDNSVSTPFLDCGDVYNEKKDEAKKTSRSVRFPDEDQLVTQYFEPANPWHDVPTTTRSQLAAEYLEACRRHNTPCIDTVLHQIRELPETSIGGATRAPRLILSECSLLGPAPPDALEAVLRKVQFTRIEVDHAELDDEGAEALFNMIEYYESATVLSLSGPRQFGIRGWQAVARMIKKSAELIELQVCGSGLEAGHAPVLARAVRALACRLRTLCLQHVALAGEPLLCLVIALKSNNSIRELRLGDNCLSVSDAAQLGSLLRYNTRIQLLDLSNNQIQDAGCAHLADAISEQSSQSPSSAGASPLSPHRCQVGGYEARGLAFLVLWNNQLTRNCSPHLSKILRSSQSLCVLNIGRNAVGAETLCALRTRRGGALVSLGLQAARLGPDAGPALAALVRDTDLQRLDLRENRLGASCLQSILSAMQDNKTLTQIDLDDPPESTNLSADENDTALIKRLTREIRALCRRNELAMKHPDEHPVHRKISLTCHTACLLRGICSEEDRRGARLRSPLPSPAPSPCASPSPASSPTPVAHSRFMVTRVTPDRESSSDSGSPSTPTRPTYCPTPSRFRVVQVMEPPQIQVHPASHPRKATSRFSVTRNYDTTYNPIPSPPPPPAPSPAPISPSSFTDLDSSLETLDLKDEYSPSPSPVDRIVEEKAPIPSILDNTVSNLDLNKARKVLYTNLGDDKTKEILTEEPKITEKKGVSKQEDCIRMPTQNVDNSELKPEVNEAYTQCSNKIVSDLPESKEKCNKGVSSHVKITTELKHKDVHDISQDVSVNITLSQNTVTNTKRKEKNTVIDKENVNVEPISRIKPSSSTDVYSISKMDLEHSLQTKLCIEDEVNKNKRHNSEQSNTKLDVIAEIDVKNQETEPIDVIKPTFASYNEEGNIVQDIHEKNQTKTNLKTTRKETTSVELLHFKTENCHSEIDIKSKIGCSAVSNTNIGTNNEILKKDSEIIKLESNTENEVKSDEKQPRIDANEPKYEVTVPQKVEVITDAKFDTVIDNKSIKSDIKYSDVVKSETKLNSVSEVKVGDKDIVTLDSITQDLGMIVEGMKDLVKNIHKPISNVKVVLKKNKSESSLDSPDLEVSRLMGKKLGSVFDSSSSLEISGSSMESLNEQQKITQELDRRKSIIFSNESSIESTSDTTPVNRLNCSVSSTESVSPLFSKTKLTHESISSLEASVSSLDSNKHERLMITSADSGIEYSLQNPPENRDDNSSNEGTLTNSSSLKDTLKKPESSDLSTSPKRTSSLLDVPALKTKGLDRMRKISWVAPSSSFQVPRQEEREVKPSHLEKLLSLFQHPSSIFSRNSDEERKSASNTPPRKDSSLTSSFWSWGTAVEKERDEDTSEDSTLSERVQVSFVDESFSKKLDSKTPSTDDNTLSEFQSFPQESEIDRVTVTTEDFIVQNIDVSVNSKDRDKSEKEEKDVPPDNKEEKEFVRPRSFAAVLKSSGSENSLDKQNSPDNGPSVNKLPSKVIRGIKENISPENTLTSSTTNTEALAAEFKRQVKNPLDPLKNEPKSDRNIVQTDLAPIATIEETCDENPIAYIDDVRETTIEVEVKKDLKSEVDLGKDALCMIYENRDFEVATGNITAKEDSLAEELKRTEIKEIIDLSPELVIDDVLEDAVFTSKDVKGLRTSPVIPDRAKLKKANSLEDLSQLQEEKSSPKTKTIVFKVPESTTPRDIPERRKYRTRSGSSPKSLPESLNKPCPLTKMDIIISKKRKKVSSLGKMARDSLLALNMSEEEIAEFRRSYKLTSVESLKSLESVSEDANSQSGNSTDYRCRACLRTSQESLMSLDSISEDCRCVDDCERPGKSGR